MIDSWFYIERQQKKIKKKTKQNENIDFVSFRFVAPFANFCENIFR